ncbi:bifunctional riboflavin kinase/FAD synthetase [Paracoccus sp. S-4012]|uniref:bifunctional riboflavin kinase/FAD synthetase n=1 Tax=Paracoccus sp. S-4012 TaxID=2665648 RepID=UPI0012B0A50C|nr:bifunctional riboflavin kinase/FAD synthetase [Paracoccus sp. S-4012]MRX51770.1 bifunctional riboflavin kinase/FAD synthetase [Paracoccus sp. S-4012]
MHIHCDWTGLPASTRGASVAMGNFDGVHRGHRAVIDAARAAGEGRPLGVITFEPHPREYFQPDAPPFRLMNPEARANRLARLGVEHLYELPFGPVLAGLTPEAFAADVLCAGLGVAHAAVGEDFRFGKGRAGDAASLEALGRRHGFGTTILPMIGNGQDRVSSTAIREALAEGRPRDAEAMLGHWHRIEGPVLHGEKRGRTLGFPTANMDLTGLHLPRFGVYAVLVDILTGPRAGETHRGAASIGVRPTFGVNAPNLETFILDFNGDLYDRHLSVALIEFLRPETSFLCANQLIIQMEQDVAEARRILAGL